MAARAGTRYRFRAAGLSIPDPASRMQAGDVHDWSIVTDPDSYKWKHEEWLGKPWKEAVIYELHAGLLGGFSGIARRLPELKEMGITAIELMPIADFSGDRNWGYDGVLPFAPDRSYGTPDDLKRLIDEAHGLGLMILLDVVYNHFGPDGNFLPVIAKRFFKADTHTPWGRGINFAEPTVRGFFIENALYWAHEFRIDGLRLDAVHTIPDEQFLTELAREVGQSLPDGRHFHLILENDNNSAKLLEQGFDAQWNDDFHHVMHVLLTGDSSGYYVDYTEEPAQLLARSLREGFIYQGDVSRYRNGKRRGSRSAHLSPTAFVNFLQNHDQIGNRAFGERLTRLTSAPALRAAVALLLLSPQIPLIFMGEEWGAREPFLYFTHHRDASLAEAVSNGRRMEFGKFPEFADAKSRNRIPDPNAIDTFEQSRPMRNAGSAEWRDLYRALLSIRHNCIIPGLGTIRSASAGPAGPFAVVARWALEDRVLTIACNLGADYVKADVPLSTPVWGDAVMNMIPPFTTICWIEPKLD